MSAQDHTLLSTVLQPRPVEIPTGLFEDLTYFANRLTSCWHLRMSRPFTRESETYRTCLRCGMRRRFDQERWRSTGRFYSSPIEGKPGLVKLRKRVHF